MPDVLYLAVLDYKYRYITILYDSTSVLFSVAIILMCYLLSFVFVLFRLDELIGGERPFVLCLARHQRS